MPYLSYISDSHLFTCIEFMFNKYNAESRKFTKSLLYKNKIDVPKLIFDKYLNSISLEDLIKNEGIRQIDKGLTNHIGEFHERILGGVEGFERGNLDGFDLKKSDNTLFAELKNKHNTMNSSSAESVYTKLESFIRYHSTATAYCVQILAKESYDKVWQISIRGTQMSNARVKIISGDRFYEVVTGEAAAFSNLVKILPDAIEEYITNKNLSDRTGFNKVFEEINIDSFSNDKDIIQKIFRDNYPYYKA